MSERAPLEKHCKKGQGLVEISCEQGLFRMPPTGFTPSFPKSIKPSSVKEIGADFISQ